jgi:hypothetical protein
MGDETQEQGVPRPWVGGDEGSLADGVYHDISDDLNNNVALGCKRRLLGPSCYASGHESLSCSSSLSDLFVFFDAVRRKLLDAEFQD